MNCKNCGASMTFIWDRDYFVCEYCGAYRFPQVLADGIKVLGEETSVSCPVCKTKLVTASAAREPILHCPTCRGLLIHQEAFRQVVKRLRANASGPPDEPTPIDRRDLQRKTLCPKCDQVMETHPYYGPGNVVVDSCTRCRLIWLDYGELKKVRDAPGRDRRQKGE